MDMKIHANGFDLNNPDLEKSIDDAAFTSGNYPYRKKMKRDEYEDLLRLLQIELVKLQEWVRHSDTRLVILFEGRDAAGKGGTIHAFKEFMNPRHARTVALSKPSESERGQWYFQRYIQHMPSHGEIVLFDRSWYNRAGVEPVMGFCTPQQHQQFLEEVPKFENMLVKDGIYFFKIWLNVGKEMQLKRFHERRHNPLKQWKLSPIDLKALDKWEDYTKFRNIMLKHSHTQTAPWTIIRSNDKRRARINAIRHVLKTLPYAGKDETVIAHTDPQILGTGPSFLSADQE